MRALHVTGNNIIYSHRVRVQHIPKEIMKLIENKIIITNIYRKQAYGSIICRYFWIGFIAFILNDKSLLYYTNLFYPND